MTEKLWNWYRNKCYVNGAIGLSAALFCYILCILCNGELTVFGWNVYGSRGFFSCCSGLRDQLVRSNQWLNKLVYMYNDITITFISFMTGCHIRPLQCASIFLCPLLVFILLSRISSPLYSFLSLLCASRWSLLSSDIRVEPPK